MYFTYHKYRKSDTIFLQCFGNVIFLNEKLCIEDTILISQKQVCMSKFDLFSEKTEE